MHPLDALNEIATLLERERSSRYKSKAFRAAADAITGLSDEQLRDAASLRRRKGMATRPSPSSSRRSPARSPPVSPSCGREQVRSGSRPCVLD